MQPQLVPMPVACFILQSSPYHVAQAVEAGELQFVFDLAGQAQMRRELRFWILDLQDPKAVARMSVESSLNKILGSRPRWRFGEIIGLLSVSWTHIRSLRDSTELPCLTERTNTPGGRVTWVQSTDLRSFLKARWLSSGESPGRPQIASRSPRTHAFC
jgi:hypothetical protein